MATTYCYDAADRLVSSTDAAVGVPVYDVRGNTTVVGTQTLTYDGADRHMSTTVIGGPTVTYTRDATDRIVERTETPATGSPTTTRYGFGGPGDSPSFTMTGASALIERHLGLVGAAMLTKKGTTQSWDYPNIHGDVFVSADATEPG